VGGDVWPDILLCRLTFPVTGARSSTFTLHGPLARVRVDWAVSLHFAS